MDGDTPFTIVIFEHQRVIHARPSAPISCHNCGVEFDGAVNSHARQSDAFISDIFLVPGNRGRREGRLPAGSGLHREGAVMFAINSIMFGLPITSSTDATTTSKGFGDVMLHRCMLTWRVCMFVFLRRGPKRLEDRRSPQSLM